MSANLFSGLVSCLVSVSPLLFVKIRVHSWLEYFFLSSIISLSADPEKVAPVFPGKFAEDLRFSALFEQRQRLPRDAFATEPSGCRVVRLADSSAMTVLARTIAAEDEFVLMAREKIRREFGVARQRVVAGVCGKIAIQVGVIAQQFVGKAAAFDRPRRVCGFVGVIGADIRPEGVGVPDEFGLWISFQHRLKTLESRTENAFPLEVLDFLKMHQDGDIQFRRQRVHSPQFRPVGLDVKLDFAQSL